MSTTNLRSLDTTALLVFDTLMEEASVSRTALRLGMTQSAVSHALNRLRSVWSDPLFVRGSGRMQPTHKALAWRRGSRPRLANCEVCYGGSRPSTPRRTAGVS